MEYKFGNISFNYLFVSLKIAITVLFWPSRRVIRIKKEVTFYINGLALEINLE